MTNEEGKKLLKSPGHVIGKRFEKAFETKSDVYKEDGKGIYFKNEPVRLASGKWIKKAGPDYLLAFGFPCVVETKATEKERFNLSEIKPHQLEALIEFKLSGYLAVVAIQFVKQNSVYFIEVGRLKAILDNGVKSITKMDCYGLYPSVENFYIGRPFNYLPVLQKMREEKTS
jgi:penicillin-binding protein-related factor A (putative recombinase)